MGLSTLLVLLALAASAFALAFAPQRAVALVALAASGLEAVLRFGIVSVSTRGFPLGLALAAALLVTGGILWAGAARRSLVTAATVIALVGAVQAAVLLGS